MCGHSNAVITRLAIGALFMCTFHECTATATTLVFEQTNGDHNAAVPASKVGGPEGVNYTDSQSGTNSQTSVFGEVKPGLIGVSATALATNGSLADSRATGTVQDAFTIDSPNFASGTTGYFLSATVSVSGLLLSGGVNQGDSSSFLQSTVLLDPATGFNGGLTSVTKGVEWTIGPGGSFISGPQTFPVTFTAPFTFGKDIVLTMSLFAHASVHSFGQGGLFGGYDANVYYGDYAMRWGGIEISDIAGNVLPPSEYSAYSTGSGINYAMAVPAPVPDVPSFFSALLGLCVLRLCRKQIGLGGTHLAASVFKAGRP